MRLSRLIQGLGIPCDTFSDTEIERITQSSKDADRHSLFVCIKGLNADGHCYAQNAYQNGCRAFLSVRPLSLPSDATVLSVPDTRQALARIACSFYGNPSHHLRVIGITGTKGKTTTACLLREILEQSGIPCGYIGTNGIHYASVAQTSANTTPDAITLQKSLSDMLRAGCKAAVIEVSSQALKQYRTDGTKFDTCVFTNLSHDHIGGSEHADMAEYIACKHRLFTDFSMQTVIYCADDGMGAEIVAGSSAKNVFTCSMLGCGNFIASDLVFSRDCGTLGVSFTVKNGDIDTRCHLPMIGTFNASNALLAIATAAQAFDIPIENSAKIIEHARISGRSEVFELPSGALAVIDYAHNGESLKQILLGLRAYAPRRLICLFGSVGERTALRRRELGEAASRFSDLCILTSDNPGKESPAHITDDILQGFTKTDTPYVRIPDREAAILFGVKEAKMGDILLLAGKGHESYQLIENRKIPFSEKDILQKATV